MMNMNIEEQLQTGSVPLPVLLLQMFRDVGIVSTKMQDAAERLAAIQAEQVSARERHGEIESRVEALERQALDARTSAARRVTEWSTLKVGGMLALLGGSMGVAQNVAHHFIR